MGKEQVTEYLDKADVYKSANSEETHPGVLNVLIDAISKPLAIIIKCLQKTGNKHREEQTQRILFRKEDLGNYRPVRLTLIPGQILDHIKQFISNYLEQGSLQVGSSMECWGSWTSALQEACSSPNPSPVHCIWYAEPIWHILHMVQRLELVCTVCSVWRQSGVCAACGTHAGPALHAGSQSGPDLGPQTCCTCWIQHTRPAQPHEPGVPQTGPLLSLGVCLVWAHRPALGTIYSLCPGPLL